ncbi:MAG: single-stranded DNA-binding protein [Fibrobacteria bacterium]|nr:single-stranded DNA-binding protein [Fibrobacteria bacterium]
MSGSLNKAMIIGNLGKDPEIRTIPSGAKVANFSLATNESYTDKGGQRVDKTEWHRIVMWRGLADIAEKYLRKGSTVFIEGKISTRAWDDQNGQKRYTTEIVADNMQMLGGRNQNTDNNSADYGNTNLPQEPYGAPQGNFQAPQGGGQNSYQQKNLNPTGLDAMPPAADDDLPF